MDLDELDIYDDLDTFEKEEEKKSVELLTLEEKYNESLKANEALQAENADLKKQIKRIGINFQNLLDTAKAEIKRKDKQIEQLRKEKDDICFRRKQPRTEYREANPFANNIDNRNKREDVGYVTTEVYKAEEEEFGNRSNTSLHTGHARDPRMREEQQTYAQNEEKTDEGKYNEKAGRHHHAHRDAHQPTRYERPHRRDREDSSRDCSRDNRTLERGHRDDHRYKKEEREHSHREYQIRREERERKNESDHRWQERDYRSERDSRHARNCSNEREKHMSSSNKTEESGDRRQHSHDKYGDRTSSRQQEKSRSNIFEGKGEKRNDGRKSHEDIHKRGKEDTDDKVLSKNTNDKRTKSYEGIHSNKDKSKIVESKSAKVKHNNAHSLPAGEVVEYGCVAKKSKMIETANDNTLCNDDKSINKNSLTKEKLQALEEQFSGNEGIDKNPNNTLLLAGVDSGARGMTTPKKTALFDSIFGSTPINAEKVNNTLLNNVMVLLKNSSGSVTTSPSNYTDTETEQITSKSTEDKIEEAADINECFVLNKSGRERKLEKDSHSMGDIHVNGDLIVNGINNENKNEKPIVDVVRDVISATVSLLSDDEDQSDVEENTEKSAITVINGAICNQESQASNQGLASGQVIGGANKDKIKILENIRLPNIYELRAQQRRLREEAAKNKKINKTIKCKETPLPKLVEKRKEIDNAAEKTMEVKDVNESCKTLAQFGKDVNLLHNSAEASQETAFTIGSKKENKGISIEENQIENINAVENINNNSVLLIETTGSSKTEAGAISAMETKFDKLAKDLENPMDKPIEPEASNTPEIHENIVIISAMEPNSDKLAKVKPEAVNAEVINENSKPKLISVCKTDADAQMKSDFSEDANISICMGAKSGNTEKRKSLNGEMLEMQIDLSVENGVAGTADNTTTNTNTDTNITLECGTISGDEIVEIAPLMETNDQPAADKKLTQMSNGNKNDKLSLKIAMENKSDIVIDVDDESTQISNGDKTDKLSPKIAAENKSAIVIDVDDEATQMSNENVNDELSLELAAKNESFIVIDLDDEATNTASQSKNLLEIKNIPETVVNKDEDTKESSNTATTNTSNNKQATEKVSKKKDNLLDVIKEKGEHNVADKPETGEGNSNSEKSSQADSKLEKIDNLSLTDADHKTTNNNASKTSDFDVEIMEDNKVLDTKCSVLNKEKSKLEHNEQTQDTDPDASNTNSVERELEDAVAYLVKSMDVGNIYCLDAEVELQSEVNKEAVEINESKDVELHPKEDNKCIIDGSNDRQTVKSKPQKLANTEKSEELRKKESLKLSKNTNSELSQKSNVELSNSSVLKLSKVDNVKLLPIADEKLSKPSNVELSITKLAPTSNLLTSQRNELVDSIKRSEIMWKFKIPKISAKRKREAIDETSIEEGEIVEETNTKSVTESSSAKDNDKEKGKQENMTHQKQQNPQQDLDTNEKSTRKDETSFNVQKLYLIPNEIEIVNINEEIDTELIETRLLNVQTPEEKRTLSADREKSERIIKEIDNWARRKVGEIPDIIENSLLLDDVNESTEKIIKSSEGVVSKNAKSNVSKEKCEKLEESESLESSKTPKSEQKETLKLNGGREYAPLLTLQLCEQHEKENEKQLANGAAGKLEDLKSVKSHGKYENPSDKIVSEILIKNKTDTQKRGGKERKGEVKSEESKAQTNAVGNTQENMKEKLESSNKSNLKKLEKCKLEATNKSAEINVEQSSDQVVIEQQILKKEERKIAITNGNHNAHEVKEELSEKQQMMKKEKVNEKETVKLETIETVDKTQKAAGPTEGVKNKAKITDTKEKVSVKPQEEIKAATNEISKHKERKEKDKHANVGLKRAGEEIKTKTERAGKEEADVLQEKRSKLELDTKKKRENTQLIHKSTDNRKAQVPLNNTPTTKAANSISPHTANSLTTKLPPNHSTITAAAAKVDQQQKVARKRQRSIRENDVNEDECADLMPQTRKRRKRCEMRIEDDDDSVHEEDCVMIKAADTIREVAADSSTGRKDILAILQNDSSGVNELLTTPATDCDLSGCGVVGSSLPAPQTPSSLPADISQDEQYREIDSRMQLMFASPKVTDKTASINLNAKSVVGKAIGEPLRQLMEAEGEAAVAQAAIKSSNPTPSASQPAVPATPVKIAPPPIVDTPPRPPLPPPHPSTLDFNVSDTSLSDFNSNSFQVSSRNITIDETHYNETDTSMNLSSLSDSSSSTKHISLGSSDYRFEKVSDNVVNLFITRKRRGKRKPISVAAAADVAGKTNIGTAAATTTIMNTITTAT